MAALALWALASARSAWKSAKAASDRFEGAWQNVVALEQSYIGFTPALTGPILRIGLLHAQRVDVTLDGRLRYVLWADEESAPKDVVHARIIVDVPWTRVNGEDWPTAAGLRLVLARYVGALVIATPVTNRDIVSDEGTFTLADLAETHLDSRPLPIATTPPPGPAMDSTRMPNDWPTEPKGPATS